MIKKCRKILNQVIKMFSFIFCCLLFFLSWFFFFSFLSGRIDMKWPHCTLYNWLVHHDRLTLSCESIVRGRKRAYRISCECVFESKQLFPLCGILYSYLFDRRMIHYQSRNGNILISIYVPMDVDTTRTYLYKYI